MSQKLRRKDTHHKDVEEQLRNFIVAKMTKRSWFESAPKVLLICSQGWNVSNSKRKEDAWPENYENSLENMIGAAGDEGQTMN